MLYFAREINAFQIVGFIKEEKKILPIEKAGVYVPGGKAAYPSSVLMNVLPAKVAGVKKIVMTTPAGADGKVNPGTLVADRAYVLETGNIILQGDAKKLMNDESVKKAYLGE